MGTSAEQLLVTFLQTTLTRMQLQDPASADTTCI